MKLRLIAALIGLGLLVFAPGFARRAAQDAAMPREPDKMAMPVAGFVVDGWGGGVVTVSRGASAVMLSVRVDAQSALADNSKTSVRFVVGPADWRPESPTLTSGGSRMINKVSSAEFALSDLERIAQGGELSLYAEVSYQDGEGEQTRYLTLNGAPTCTFSIPLLVSLR
jgi:hypothetical protein